MRRPDRNLVLVHTPRLQARSDFETIRLKLTERAPDIEVIIVENGQRHSVTRRQASRRPTLVFSPVALREFRPLRGKIYAGRRQSNRGLISALTASVLELVRCRGKEKPAMIESRA